jgi:hypothetical protein
MRIKLLFPVFFSQAILFGKSNIIIVVERLSHYKEYS